MSRLAYWNEPPADNFPNYTEDPTGRTRDVIRNIVSCVGLSSILDLAKRSLRANFSADFIQRFESWSAFYTRDRIIKAAVWLFDGFVFVVASSRKWIEFLSDISLALLDYLSESRYE